MVTVEPTHQDEGYAVLSTAVQLLESSFGNYRTTTETPAHTPKTECLKLVSECNLCSARLAV